MRVELVGGPLDGELLPRSARPDPFVWLDARKRLCSSPAEGRALYHFIGERSTDEGRVFLYEYAELQLVRCSGCGFFTPRAAEGCALCEHPLTTL